MGDLAVAVTVANSADDASKGRPHTEGTVTGKGPAEADLVGNALSRRLADKLAMMEQMWHQDPEELCGGAGQTSPGAIGDSTSYGNFIENVIGDAMRKRLEEKFREMQLQQEAHSDGATTKKLLTFTGRNSTKFRKDRKDAASSSLRTKYSRGAWNLAEEKEEPKAAMPSIGESESDCAKETENC